MPTVLIGGGSGLVGMHLSRLLQKHQYEVLHLSRKKDLKAVFPRYAWNIEKGSIDEEALVRADYIINLAGAGIADKRWTSSRKKLIIDSRVNSTLLLKNTLQKIGKQVKAYLSASAVGYYGDRGAELMEENSPPKPGDFLSDSTVQWEVAADTLQTVTERLVKIRIGIVLSAQGGALPKMMFPVKFRVGTYFGDGQMYYSWIHIDDLAQIFLQALESEKMTGVYNAVAPNPVTNYQLNEGIAQALDVGMISVPAPAFVLRLAMGEMADVVLSSIKVSAKKIEQTEFTFQYPDLLPALQDIVQRKV